MKDKLDKLIDFLESSNLEEGMKNYCNELINNNIDSTVNIDKVNPELILSIKEMLRNK